MSTRLLYCRWYFSEHIIVIRPIETQEAFHKVYPEGHSVVEPKAKTKNVVIKIELGKCILIRPAYSHSADPLDKRQFFRVRAYLFLPILALARTLYFLPRFYKNKL